MTPRRLGLLFGLAALAATGPRCVVAQGTLNIQPSTVYQSEGRNPVPFSVTCSTPSWTVVVSSDAISRSTFMEAISSNTAAVCLLPFTGGVTPTVAVSSQCVTATKGIELPPNSAYTDYSKAAWACAASSGTVNQVIKGVRTRDAGDYGNIGNARGY